MKRSVGWGANEGRYWFFNVHVISCVLMACIDVCRCISLPTIQQFTVIHTVHRKYSFSFFPSAHWRQSKSSRQNVKGTWRRISLSTFFILRFPFNPFFSLMQTPFAKLSTRQQCFLRGEIRTALLRFYARIPFEGNLFVNEKEEKERKTFL